MKIAIISDLHLGFRQYGSLERENDFYSHFEKVCKEISKHNPNIVIIGGDLFHTPNPTPAAINAYREGIGNLKTDMICVIKGNHTMVLRDNHYSIDDFFSDDEFEGYYYLDDSSMTTHGHAMSSPYDMEFKKYSGTKVKIDGITYRGNSSIDEFLDVQKTLASAKSEEGTYRILVVHQSFKEFCGFTGEELSINDINTSPYDAVICGHIHSRFDTVLSDGTKFIQPGSIERLNTAEAFDEETNGKGFYILETSDNSLEFHRVKCNRAFFLGEISLESENDLENHLEKLENDINKMEVPPIISYKYKNYGINMVDLRNKIGLIKENVLLNKSHIDDCTQEEIVVEISDNEIPTIMEAINLFGENSDLTKEEIDLATDIHKSFSNNTEIKALLDKYYEKHFEKKINDIEYDSEFEDLIEYFKRD